MPGRRRFCRNYPTPSSPSMSSPHCADIFERALSMPTAERDAWVAEACSHDAALREQVQSLLRAHNDANSFMESPAEDLKPASPTSDVSLEEKAGDRIGRYKLLQKIGEGGCGVVYMAEQEESVRRRVAIKVIKL